MTTYTGPASRAFINKVPVLQLLTNNHDLSSHLDSSGSRHNAQLHWLTERPRNLFGAKVR